MRYLTILFIFFGLKLNAQEIILLDALTELPIEGVSVSSKTKDLGVISNNMGITNLSVFSSKETLIIQHIAYQKIEQIKSSIQQKTIFLVLKTHSLENVEITESKESLKSTLKHLKITPAIMLKSQSAQTSDLLEKTMGVSIQNSQNGGGSPNLRGMEANRLLIVVDGIPLNNTIFRSGHLQSTATINPIFLKDAEVLFGPASVAYGNGAMGGAILFSTKRPENKNSTQFTQQYESSSDAVFTSIISNYKTNNSANISGFSLKSYGNLKMGSNRKHGFKNWGKEAIITENNIQKGTAYQQADFFHKTLFKLSNTNFLLFNSQFSTSSNINRFDKLNDIKDGEQKYKNWYYGPQKRFFQSARLKNYFQNFASDESVFTVAYQNIKESRHKQKNGDELLNNRTETLHILDFKSDFLKQFNRFKLNYGFDSRFQKLNSTANLSDKNTHFYNTTRYPDGGANVINNAIYSQINLDCTKNLLLLVGSRYSINSLSATFQDTTVIHLPFNGIRVHNKSLSNSLQLVYKYNASLRINGAVSNGFRNPNTDDIGKVFSKNDLSVIVPNNNLSPEKSLNIETGIHLKIKNIITVQLQIFQTQITDAIERREATLNELDSMNYDGEMMKIMMNTNIGRATIKGLNFAYQLKINKQFSHNTIINALHGETVDGLPLAHIPPTSITSTLNYEYNNQAISLSTHYNALKKAIDYDLGGVDNLEEATQIGNPSWYTLSLKYSNSLDKNLTFIAGIQNIMDIHYKTFGSGISASGRNFTLSLRANF
ncbi:MAG: TonB-dependent receptor [Flavobacteriales bacterium]|jgi:hemoglobin/transferrin/lactoferrin receptor protein|nr:TonB-dependent receptor [Flavobacteriales bacterium]